jgi:hypothetical protein
VRGWAEDAGEATAAPVPDTRAGQLVFLQQTAGNAAVAGLMRARGVSRKRQRSLQQPAALLRYQAGARGHGGIEAEGLSRAGFRGDMEHDEIGRIYFGNWLRDWSQVPPGKAKSLVRGAVVSVLNVLSMGEFDRPFTEDQLGAYMPSEHMDNPLGGKNVESPDNTSPEARAAAAANEAQLSPDQRAWLQRERSPEFQAMITAAARASGLPEYIERGKAHSKEKLRQAVLGTDEAEWEMNLGNALHGIEDYFSHSNFTEVALAMLAQEGNAAATRVLDDARRSSAGGFDASTAGGTDAMGRPGIITGTYGDESHGANQIVSMTEQLKSEVLTGALRIAWIKGMARIAGRGEGAALRVEAELVGGAPAAVIGGAGGLVGGVAAGFSRGHGFFGTIESMAEGAVEGAEGGAEAGVSAVGDVGEGLGTGAGYVIGATEGAALVAQGLVLFGALDLAVKAGLDEVVSDKGTEASAVGAPREPGAAAAAPTHSQLAKDAPEHAVYATSRALAVHADTVLGGAVRTARGMPDKEAAVATVLPLVDEIVAHPSANRPQWEQPLSAALAARASHD